MGLRERLSEIADSYQITALGVELNIDLYEAFFGVWDEGEIPLVLWQCRLISGSVSDLIYSQLEAVADPESLLRGYVERAYYDFHGARYLH
jgi:hypothetical protein